MDREREEIIDETKEDLNENDSFSGDEIDWNAFTEIDEEWEQEKLKRKKKRALIVKIVGTILILSLIVSGLQIWFKVFSLPSLEFVKVSERLSEEESIQQYRESVVVVETGVSKGTGFNVSDHGLIVTNHHVVENTKFVQVRTRESGIFNGEVIANYPELDLAIVDINTDPSILPPLPVSFNENWEEQIGEEVIFIGNPLAYAQIANEGTISGSINLKNWDIPVMQITAPIYSGNSGSPVLNSNGEVIGIIFGTLRNNESEDILGVAVPSFYLKDILEELDIK